MVNNKGDGVNLKYLSLFVLTIQNATLILSIRYTRTRESKDMYITTTAVVMAELFKMLACFGVILKDKGSVGGLLEHVHYYTVILWKDAIKISVPAILYVIQNNLQYVAISNLEAAVFQVTYQLKIMTTAIFSVFLLRKELIKTQWVALILLFGGVSLVQLSQGSASKSNGVEQNPVLGLVAVLLSCCSSGFAGVYFEKLLKGSSDISIWMRNIHLAGYGVIFGLIGVFMNDYKVVSEKSFFFGYDGWVWWVVCMQAFGGLLVAVVVKYADNILKGFATSLAIIVSCVVSVFLWNFQVTLQFSMGTLLVLGAVYLYSLPKPQAKILPS